MQLLSYLTSNHTFVIYLIYISLYSVNRIDNLIRYKKKKNKYIFLYDHRDCQLPKFIHYTH